MIDAQLRAFAAFARTLPCDGSDAIYFYTRDVSAAEKPCDLQARMFHPGAGGFSGSRPPAAPGGLFPKALLPGIWPPADAKPRPAEVIDYLQKADVAFLIPAALAAWRDARW